MKTTVSIPDQLFQRADAFAKTQGVSRSQLFARALEAYLERHEEAGITTRLNTVYSKEDSALSPELTELGFEALRATEDNPFAEFVGAAPLPEDAVTFWRKERSGED